MYQEYLQYLGVPPNVVVKYLHLISVCVTSKMTGYTGDGGGDDGCGDGDGCGGDGDGYDGDDDGCDDGDGWW